MPSAPVIQNKKPATKRPTLLIVDDEPEMLELAADVCARSVEARVLQATSLREAQRILDKEDISLVIADVKLPDGDGTTLLQKLRDSHPNAGAVVISGDASMEQSVSCFRSGAVDYLAKPFSAEQFSDRVTKALQYQSQVVRTEKRLTRLKSAVKKLNNARHMVGKKVDLLCNDLVHAYGDLARQFEDVRVRENFRKTIGASVDLEQMLCHTMDWLLKQCGYTNIAIYLAGDDGVFDLGAYMKYTIPGSKMLTDAICHGTLESVIRDDFIHWTDVEANENLSPAELEYLPNHTVLAVNCTYLGESLGTIIMFRDGKSPFTADNAATLRSIASVFAHGLTTLARKADIGDEDQGDDYLVDENSDPAEDPKDEYGDADNNPWSEEPPKPKRKKKDDADWWKRGEPPPF
ncbi:MAG: response regulator [Tepidisphaeraceae bacterium]